MIRKDTDDISATDIHILEAGLRWINESRDEFSHKLYYRLLRDHPESTASLHLIDPTSFNRHIIQIIERVIDDLRSSGTIGSAHKAEWEDLVPRVTSEQWMGIAETFLDVLSEFAEDAWSPAIESAWRKTIQEVSIVMQKPLCESLPLAGTFSPSTKRTNFYLSRPLIFIFGILVFLTGSLASLSLWRRYRLTERKPGRALVQKACIVVA